MEEDNDMIHLFNDQYMQYSDNSNGSELFGGFSVLEANPTLQALDEQLYENDSHNAMASNNPETVPHVVNLLVPTSMADSATVSLEEPAEQAEETAAEETVAEEERRMESDDVISAASETHNADTEESGYEHVEDLDQLMPEENAEDAESDTARDSVSPNNNVANNLIIRNRVPSNDFSVPGFVESRILPSVVPTSPSQRDTFMQRFRRILFILSSRRRRLIRSGLISMESDETDENPRETLEHLARSLGAPLEIDDLEDLRPRGSRPEESIPENAVRFDTNLPAEHFYMGSNLSRVSGVNYLEAGQQHNLLLFMHQEILFPGEILPFMISSLVIDGGLRPHGNDGLLFGICFPFINDKRNPTYLYGVTCQIYEKGSDNRGNTLIKSRALQRFLIKSKDIIGTLEYINDRPSVRCYCDVEILPEIYLPDPLGCINMGSMSRFRDNKDVRRLYRRYQVATTPWPLPVYDFYNIRSIVEKARTQLAQHKIDTMPSDPTQLSNWLVRNLHLSESQIHTIFLTNCVNKRLKIIASTFKAEAVFSCRFCTNNIASCRELFAMSKHGVQTQYCNAAGFIHKTNTVYHVNTKAIVYSGSPSSEFSWFPGYRWQIILCKVCKHHMGWEYKAEEDNMVPKLFYGISSSSVRVCSTQLVGDEDRVRSSLQLNSIRALFNSHRNAYGVPFDDIETNTDDSSDSI